MFFDQFPDFTNPAVITALLTLAFLEVILGVDNIIFISIISDKLPGHQQKRARIAGLLLAMIMRILLLFAITWLIKLTQPLFSINFIKDKENNGILISARDLILIAGGIFLVFKTTLEIHRKLSVQQAGEIIKAPASFNIVILQIVLIDIIFSFDSILTAIGLVDNLWIMIIAVVISIGIMMLSSGIVTRFVNRNPAIQMLALSFLIAIGILLIAEGLHQAVPKSYIYSAMAFSLIVEFLNMRFRRNTKFKTGLPSGKPT